MFQIACGVQLIAPQKIGPLLGIIQSCSLEDSFACQQEFSTVFQTLAEKFKARCWIAHLLAQGTLKAHERLVALFLLQCDYDCDARALPFLHVFLQILRKADETSGEARFISKLIQLSAEEAQACSKHFKEEFHKTVAGYDGAGSRGKTPPLLQCSNCTCAPSHERCVGVVPNAVVPHMVVALDGWGAEGARPSMALCTSQPRFARPAPPLIAPVREETYPALPCVVDGLLWDDSSEVSPAQIAAMQQQLAEAQCKPLQPMQHKELILALDAWPRIVHHIGFCPAQLPGLVEHNNLIAVELLLKLISTNSPRVNAFLGALIHMDLSVHAMEVVKTLTSAATLPEGFIHRYIHACIAACEAIEQRSQKQQNRPVRLVCVFLQSLINTKIVDIKAIQFEVPPFCIKFSRIREAAALYKMIHQ